jgi:hypothetical protein
MALRPRIASSALFDMALRPRIASSALFAIGVALFAAATLAACRAGGPASPFLTLDRDASPLRARFNADAGKVRVLMLVAPT